MRRKSLLITLIVFVVFSICAFAACDFGGSNDGNNNNSSNNSSNSSNNNSSNNNNSNDGNNNDGAGNNNQTHTHVLVHVDAVEAGCTTKGTLEHWKCSGCNKYFSDDEGKTEVQVASLSVAAKGHSYSHYECTVCENKLSTTSGLQYKLNDAQDGYIVTDFSYSSFSTQLVIPEKYNNLPVKEIGERAFYYDLSKAGANSPLLTLTTVYLPDSLETIGEYAFYSCEAITSVNFGNSVKKIDAGAFSFCEKLESIEIPDSVTSIGINAFYGDNALKSIVIGKNVNFIGMGAFDVRFTDNIKLETVTFKETTGWQTKGQYAKNWSNSTVDLTDNAKAIQFLRKTNVTNHLGRGN